MRIFQILESSTSLLVKANKTWYRNLHEPLVELGHDVVYMPAEEARVAMMNQDSELKAEFSEKLWTTFKKEHDKKPFDLFFAYLFDGMVEPRVIDDVRNLGVPTCNFSCNNAHQFYLVKELSPHFDYCLHAERDTGAKFESIGAKGLWWPMASNPKYFKPEDLERTIDVSFVGDNYGLRTRYVRYLLDNGVDIQVYGPRWMAGAQTPLKAFLKRYYLILKTLVTFSPQERAKLSCELGEHDIRRLVSKIYPSHVNPPVSDAELISLYSKSKITLGILDVHDNHDPSLGTLRHIHLREFEAPMSGALYCTGYSDELAELFDPEKELITYHDEGELVEKVKFYLSHESEAEKIRLAGYQRALNDHTYQRRFEQLFEAIGLK